MRLAFYCMGSNMPDPRRDHRRLKHLRAYLKNPRTLDDIEGRFSLSRRTVYRWLDYLREDGAVIISRKDFTWMPPVKSFSVLPD
jgi:DNA-binding transcriptional ArsR family regulator